MEKAKSFGPFEVRGELGRGAGGVVYVAWDPEHDRTAAVKVFVSAPKEATAAMARLRRDAQAAGALGHPNIAAVLGVGEHEGQTWVATEFVPGVSLAQVLRSHAPLPIERVLDVWRQLSEGLAHAHREGVFHLDLKPADVRVTPTGEIKMVDFGSWHLKALERQGPGPAEEGLHYRAPEILAGRRPDRRADVFSVGTIVYELVSYRKAFPGDSTTDVVRGLTRCEPDLACLPRTPFTPGFERVLAASLARSPRSATRRSRTCTPTSSSSCATPCLACAAPPRRGAGRPSARSSSPPSRARGRRTGSRRRSRAAGSSSSSTARTRRRGARRRRSSRSWSTARWTGWSAWPWSYAADGEFALATGIAEKVERLAPWSPRYLRLQVYLDEEGARRGADGLVATAREHRAAGRDSEARAAVERRSRPCRPPSPRVGFLEQLPPAAPPPAAPLRAAPGSAAVTPAGRRAGRCDPGLQAAPERRRRRRRSPQPARRDATALSFRRAPALPLGTTTTRPARPSSARWPSTREPARPGAPEDPARARLSGRYNEGGR